MKVTINVTLDHKGNPRGSGKAEAILIFIDRQGKRYERKAAAAGMEESHRETTGKRGVVERALYIVTDS